MKLLIVDDEIELVSGLIRFLGRFGHNCATALDLNGAIDHITHDASDLVITNYRLPDGDGLDVIRTVQQKLPRTPVILMTGYHESFLEEASEGFGRRDTNCHIEQAIGFILVGMATIKS